VILLIPQVTLNGYVLYSHAKHKEPYQYRNFELGFLYMKDHLTPAEYRKELYDYLEAEGLEVTEERHDKIRYLVKMAIAVATEDKGVEITRLSNKLLLYKEKYGELDSKKDNEPKPKHIPQPRIQEKPDGGFEWYAPRTFG